MLSKFLKTHSRRLVAAIAVAAAVLVAAAFTYRLAGRERATVDGRALPTRVVLPYAAAFNYRQSHNSCGPYATAAAARVLEPGVTISSEDLAKAMPWRWPNSFTMPQGLRTALRARGHEVHFYDASALAADDRLRALKQHLAAGDPVILIVAQSTQIIFQHYITVLGYDEAAGVFFVYDSAIAAAADGLTEDRNGDDAGNVTMSADGLLKYWSGGGGFGVYRWFFLTAK